MTINIETLRFEIQLNKLDNSQMVLSPLVVGELLDRLEAAERECDAAELMSLALRAKVAEMEKQEPIDLRFPSALRKMWASYEIQNWIEEQGPLYALPGAQPAPSVPEGWIQRGMAELEAIRSRQDDDTLLDDRTLIERIGKAMLAAAPDVKP